MLAGLSRTKLHLALTVLGLIIGFSSFLLRNPFASAVDFVIHFRVALDFKLAIADKLGYPDWDARSFNGKGGPFFRFAMPLPLFLSAFFQFLGISGQLSMKLVIVSAALICIWGLRKLAAEIDEEPDTGLVNFLIFSHPFLVLLLNHFFVFQNLFAIFIIPCAIAGLLMTMNNRKHGFHLTAASMSALVGSHLMTALLVGYAMMLTSIIFALKQPKNLKSWRPAGLFILSCVFSVVITSPFVFPAMLSKGETNFQNAADLYRAGKHHTPFLDNNVVIGNNKPDLPVLKAFSILLPYFAEGVAKNLPMFSELVEPWRDKDLKPLQESKFCILMAILRPWFLIVTLLVILLGILTLSICPISWQERSVLIAGLTVMGLAFSPAKIIWTILPGLNTLQFPWRCILPGSMMILPLTGKLFSRKFFGKPVLIFALIIVPWVTLALLFSALAGTYPYGRLVIAYNRAFTKIFVPSTVPKKFPTPDDPEYYTGDYHLGELISHQAPSDKDRAESKLIDPIERGFEWATFTFADVPADSKFRLNTHWDDLWRVSVNGRELKPELHKPDGTMIVDLPAGEVELELFRISPPWRITGWVLSSLAGLIWLATLNYNSDKQSQ